MTLEELENIIRHSEVSRVQFKERIDDNYKIGAEMVAFSNSRGGILIIGVKDKTGEKNPLSYEELQDTNQALSNIATHNVDPRIGIETDSVSVDGGHIIVVTIKEGINKPYKDNKGIIWAKQGSDKRRIVDNNEIAEMMEECGTFIPEVSSVDATIDDLDLDTFKEYLLKRFEPPLRKNGIKPSDYDAKTLDEIISAISRNITLDRLLTNLRFMRPDGRLTMAGLLLFGKAPQLVRPTLTAKCISFYGTSIGGSRFRDRVNDADMEGNLRHQYDTIMSFFRRNLRYVQPGEEFNTQGVLELSDIALSELVMNALIHRSLVRPAPIRIFILDDKIEIHSPGTLPQGLAIGDIANGTSMPRNEQLFYHANFLLPYSGAGTGILRAIDEGLKMNFKNDEQTKEFVITIPRKVSNEPASPIDEPVKELSNGKSNQAEELSNLQKELSSEKSNQVTNEVTNQVTNQDTNQVTNQDTDQVTNQDTHHVSDQGPIINTEKKLSRKDLTGKQKDILNFCSVPRSALEIMERLSITNQYYNRAKYIQPLVEAGFLKLTIPNSPTSPNQKYVKVKRK
ncbi:MAG: putative DNA binding domain-containing protein [Muribaculaceae bacterium]|nr:putative DNA binding domain-containing protein [Muribaculaceae bacterium]